MVSVGLSLMSINLAKLSSKGMVSSNRVTALFLSFHRTRSGLSSVVAIWEGNA